MEGSPSSSTRESDSRRSQVQLPSPIEETMNQADLSDALTDLLGLEQPLSHHVPRRSARRRRPPLRRADVGADRGRSLGSCRRPLRLLDARSRGRSTPWPRITATARWAGSSMASPRPPTSSTRRRRRPARRGMGTMEAFSGVAALSRRPQGVRYGPLAEATTSPTWCSSVSPPADDGDQRRGGDRLVGKPQCQILPKAADDGVIAASMGCASPGPAPAWATSSRGGTRQSGRGAGCCPATGHHRRQRCGRLRSRRSRPVLIIAWAVAPERPRHRPLEGNSTLEGRDISRR